MVSVFWKGGTGLTKSDVSTQANWVDAQGTAITNTIWNSGNLSAHDIVLDYSKNISASGPVGIVFDGSPTTITWNSLYIKYNANTKWHNMVQFGNSQTTLVLSGLDVRQSEMFNTTAATTIKFTGIPHHSSMRRNTATGTVSGGNADGDLYIKIVAGSDGDGNLNRYHQRTHSITTGAVLSYADQYTTAGMFYNTSSRAFFTFLFEPPNSSVLVLDNGIYPKMDFDCASTNTAKLSFDDIYISKNEYSNTHREVDMLLLTIDSSFTVKPTNHELRNRQKHIKLSGGYDLDCATFDMGYATLEIIPTTTGAGLGAYIPSSDTEHFGPIVSATQKMGMNVKLTKLIIGSPVNEKYKMLIADNNIIACEELQIKAGGRLYGPSYGDDNTAEIHCLAPPIIDGDWNFTEISVGIYRASGTSPTLPPTMGGTGLNEMGLQGQVLSVKSNGKGLEWAASAGGSNTTYSINIPASTTNLRLTGSDATADNVGFLGGGATTVTRTDENTFTISSTDNNTVYTHPNADGSLHVPATSITNENKVLTAGSSAGALAWGYTVEKAVPSSALFTDTVYTHPNSVVTNIDTTNAEVIDTLTTNTTGHITAMTKRTMTLADLAVGGNLDLGANKITTTTTNGDVMFKENGTGGFIFYDDTESEYLKIAAGGILQFYLSAAGGASGPEQIMQYRDAAGSMRNFLSIYSDDIYIHNRAANGKVIIQANTATAGNNDVTAATFEDDKVTFGVQPVFPAAGIKFSDGSEQTVAAGAGSASFLDDAEIIDLDKFYAQNLFPFGSNFLKYGNPFTTYVQYFPFIAPKSGTITTMGTRISSGYGGTEYPMHIGVYTDVNGTPTALMGKISLTINGNNTINSTSFSASITVVKGTQYWVGYLATGAKTGSFWGSDAASAPIIYSGQSAGNQSARKNVRSDNNATALPSTPASVSGYWASMWPQIYMEC